MEQNELRQLMRLFFKPHPWHGISPGAGFPAEMSVFIEQVPTDTVKYEIDKVSGYLKLDRPQKFSSQSPALYGFVPRTYCGTRVGQYSAQKTGNKEIKGDGDPIDICVLSERSISHGDVLVNCIPIGGIRMIDAHEADDKIIAVMKDDAVYGQINDVTGLPEQLVDRLCHYFLSYKDLPSPTKVRNVEIESVYGRAEALKVLQLSQEDYEDKFDNPNQRFQDLIEHLTKASQ
jgi:inorganic pyrophosphatase